MLAVERFSIVVLPDTQYYSKYQENVYLFANQTQWIADEIEKRGNPRNIAFVSHLGDVVNDGAFAEQWRRATASMAPLDGGRGGAFVVPFGVLPGNHDFHTIGDKASGIEEYVTNFGPQHFEAASWFGGADPSGMNSFQRFSAGGFSFLHLSLEWRPDVNVPVREPSPLQWASEIIGAHPGLPVILSTHEYICDKPAGRSATGDAVFHTLVESHDQIFLVLSGHFHNLVDDVPGTATERDGQWYQVSTNQRGREVIEVLQDFQDYAHGGDGWLRIINFDIEKKKLAFETYSPALHRYQTPTFQEVGQHASHFAIPLDFASRFSFGQPPNSSLPNLRRRHPRLGRGGALHVQ
jgi:hypothetical protein